MLQLLLTILRPLLLVPHDLILTQVTDPVHEPLDSRKPRMIPFLVELQTVATVIWESLVDFLLF